MMKSAESLTLDDMGELMKIWHDSYQAVPAEAKENIAATKPTIDQYLQTALGRLYMYRLISRQDLHGIAGGATTQYFQWATISFGIGLEAGLGHIKDTDVWPYLVACNQPYLRSLLGFLSLQLNHGKVGKSHARKVRGEMSKFINSAAMLLANSGQVSRESVKIRYEGKQSPVAAFLRDIDVSIVQERMGQHAPPTQDASLAGTIRYCAQSPELVSSTDVWASCAG